MEPNQIFLKNNCDALGSIIFRYLKGTLNYKLTYTQDLNFPIHGFCDSDWGSDVKERRSITGYLFFGQLGVKRDKKQSLYQLLKRNKCLSIAAQEFFGKTTLTRTRCHN